MEQHDVVIIGGGPAGLAAAVALFRKGVRDILLVEREKSLGGILRQCIHDGFGLTRFGENLSGPEYARRFIDEVERLRIPYLVNASVTSVTPEKTLTVMMPGCMKIIRARAIILAMGCRERTRGALGIPGDRPSGVFTAGVAQAYMNLYNRMPGREAVILGSGDIGLIMARRLTLEGAKVHAVFEIQPQPSGLNRNIVQCLNDYDIPLYLSHTITAIHGQDRVRGVTVSKVDDCLQPIPGTETEWPCDTVILSVGLIPENELSREAGIQLDSRTRSPLVDEFLQTSQKGFFAAGNVLHVHDLVDNVSKEAETLASHVAVYLKENGLPECKLSSPVLQKAWDRSEQPMLTCVMCPNGCGLSVQSGENGEFVVKGARCSRGEAYARQEMLHPMRTISSSVTVLGGERPLASVRLSRPVPREKIPDVTRVIHETTVQAPVAMGEVLIPKILGLDSDVIATVDVVVKY